jgi:hypothetical protein
MRTQAVFLCHDKDLGKGGHWLMTDRFLKVKLKSVSQSELIATDQVEETDFYKGQLLNVETPAQSSGQLTEENGTLSESLTKECVVSLGVDALDGPKADLTQPSRIGVFPCK